MKPSLGLEPLLALLSAGPLGTAEWTLPHSDVQIVPAPDGHLYRLLVSWPVGEPPAQGWPVLWLLDGEDNFAIATMTARRFADVHPEIGKGVIVAIESGHRDRRVEDYTPPSPGYAIPNGFPACGLPTGGAERFLDLIDEVFRPLVEGRWHLDPARQTLAGHGFGGLLALHAMFTGRPYSTVVAVSPSLWYGGGSLAAGERRADPCLKARLLVVNGMQGNDFDDHGGAAAEALVTRWQRRGAEAEHLSLDGKSHGSTMLAAMGATVTTAFSAGR
ncbi:alpha/beta hydrolase-fold protein [Novosphingobium sp. BL-8H]|uniref:alpha/beta hydrolase n=1 Tax=Novosphingobium sp. BL-8H TaxID=3127640 RepID=UPI003757F248